VKFKKIVPEFVGILDSCVISGWVGLWEDPNVVEVSSSREKRIENRE